MKNIKDIVVRTKKTTFVGAIKSHVTSNITKLIDELRVCVIKSSVPANA